MRPHFANPVSNCADGSNRYTLDGSSEDQHDAWLHEPRRRPTYGNTRSLAIAARGARPADEHDKKHDESKKHAHCDRSGGGLRVQSKLREAEASTAVLYATNRESPFTGGVGGIDSLQRLL